MVEHKHRFGPWKKLIFTKVRWCKECGFCQKKELLFQSDKDTGHQSIER